MVVVIAMATANVVVANAAVLQGLGWHSLCTQEQLP